MRGILLGGAAVLAIAAFLVHVPARAADPHVVPAPVADLAEAAGPQTVVLSGGCFWGVQGVFEHVKGVTRAVSGYAGGKKETTEVNRQGPDEGTQYRSEVFAVNADEARVAKAYVAQLDGAHVFSRPIATRVDMLPGFYPAEAYHQDFLATHPDYPYIVYNDLPKVAALKADFPADYREQPTMVGSGS